MVVPFLMFSNRYESSSLHQVIRLFTYKNK